MRYHIFLRSGDNASRGSGESHQLLTDFVDLEMSQEQ